MKTRQESNPLPKPALAHRDVLPRLRSGAEGVHGSACGEGIPRRGSEVPEDRIIDVHYADLLRDPLETMRKLYRALGDEFTAEAEAGMRAWLSDNPQDKFGRHEYRLTQYGLSLEKLEPMFERYLSRYEVEREG